MTIARWPKQPVIYEIDTWVWLAELGRRYKRSVTLGDIPPEEWERLGGLGIDAVWFMGVWERSPAGIRIARAEPHLQRAFREALPDYSDGDVVGSPYCIHRYVPDSHLGGPEGLASARSMLARRGLRLILDFVPNHVARDHPWVLQNPEYFVQGNEEDLQRTPEGFFRAGGKVIACGRDPYFPPWTDTAQLNAFQPGLRSAAIEILHDLSRQCDGVRCDMAMLLLSHVFERTWGARAGGRPSGEYWQEAIQTVRRSRPDFLFLAEAYWDLEWELQQLGFDYCYDKRLYDRLVQGDPGNVRAHLQADISYQDRLVRFVENHDEPRATYVFPPKRLRAVALAVSSLPGAKLFHEGQLEGRRVRLPVQLGRRREEDADPELEAFYRRLLGVIARCRAGEWRLCDSSPASLLAWCWSRERDRYLIVVNLSGEEAQGRVSVPWADEAKRTLELTDLFNGEVYRRDGSEMLDPGLHVILRPWGFHFLSCNL